jgi:hypothetical protein
MNQGERGDSAAEARGLIAGEAMGAAQEVLGDWRQYNPEAADVPLDSLAARRARETTHARRRATRRPNSGVFFRQAGILELWP